MNFLQSLGELKEQLGVRGGKSFSKQERETIYAVAHGKYETGAYLEAADFFTQLLLHDPYDTRFWKGLAAARQMEKDYKAALHAWAIYALLSGHNPNAHFHAAECYLSMGDKEEAKKALALATKHLQTADPLRNRVEQLKERIDGH